MLMNRIVGALTFRREVYAEVEHDTSFTGTAWTLVVIVAVLNQLGNLLGADSEGSFLVATIVAAALEIFAFAVGAMVMAWVGRGLFSADVTYDEIVRTLGLAYVWRVIGVLGIVPFLRLILLPVLCLAGLLALVSSFIAIQEALDLDGLQTLITILAGWIVIGVMTFFTNSILALLGLGASAIGGAISG